MIRVAFVLNDSGDGWLGGTSYYRNLLGALASCQRIKPVIFTGNQRPPNWIVESHPGLEVVQSKLVLASSASYKLRKSLARILDHDIAMEQLLRRNRIDVLSHAGHLGRRARIPTICWIPDFQHVRMPEFFDAKERTRRDRSYGRMADACTRLLVSSEAARKDLRSLDQVLLTKRVY